MSFHVSDSGARLKENGTCREGLEMKKLQLLEVRAGVGYGVVNVKWESIREEAMKRCVCHGEIHIWM